MIAGGRNASAYGLSKGTIKRIRTKISGESMLLEGEVTFPKLVIQSKYKGEGRYADFVLNARGNITIAMCK